MIDLLLFFWEACSWLLSYHESHAGDDLRFLLQPVGGRWWDYPRTLP